MVTQRLKCLGELSITLSTAPQFTKSKVVLLILPFWDRNYVIVLLLLLSRTAFPISPVIFLSDTLQIIPSCGSASFVDPLCFHSSLTNNIYSTLHSIFIYDGQSISWSSILSSCFPCTWLNYNASGVDVHTFCITCNMSACFIFWLNLCSFLDNKNKAFSLSHPTLTLPSVTPWRLHTDRINYKPSYISVSSFM